MGGARPRRRRTVRHPGQRIVTRSGGFAGIRRSGEVVLGDDPRTPEVESLLGRIDFGSGAAPAPQPDRFVYTFDSTARRRRRRAGPHPRPRQLAMLVLP